MDRLTIERIQLLHPKLRAVATLAYNDMCKALTGNAFVRFTYTLRTFAEQDALYAQGRTKLFDAAGNRLGIVTNAKAGQSLHNFGLAFDIAMVADTDGDGKYETGSWDTVKDWDKDGKSDWMECVAIAKRYGLEWGGDWKSFKDLPHFQMTYGYTLADLQSLLKRKKVDACGYVVL